MSIFEGEPINNITWEDARQLHANEWNPNYVMRPEFKLLELSLLTTGWIQPILISSAGLIIDGFHRWRISSESKKIIEKYRYMCPCATLNITEPEAMLLTVRINRAKGTHQGFLMSTLIRRVIDSFNYSNNEVAEKIGATLDEVELLYQENIFKEKKIDRHEYSKAWVPERNR